MIAALFLMSVSPAYLAKLDPYGPMVDATTGAECPAVRRGSDPWDELSFVNLDLLNTNAATLKQCSRQRQALIDAQRRMKARAKARL